MVVAWAKGDEGNGELLFNRYRVLILQDENSSRLVAQQSECT